MKFQTGDFVYWKEYSGFKTYGIVTEHDNEVIAIHWLSSGVVHAYLQDTLDIYLVQ